MPLFPFQNLGAEFLASHRIALLADEMGLGKTPQAISAFDLCKSKRTLVLCPASLRANWTHEWQKFSVLGTAGTPVLQQSERPTADSLVCSYDLAARSELLTMLLQRPWDILCLDEAHYLTSTEAQRTAAVLGASGLIHRATRTWFLTGTPMRNHPGELWPMMYCAGLTQLTHQQFLDRYTVQTRVRVGPGRFRDKVVGANNLRIPELRQVLSPILLRRTKAEVLPDMPPISISEVVVEPGPVTEDAHFLQLHMRKANIAAIVDAQSNAVHDAMEKQAMEEGKLKALKAMEDNAAVMRRYHGLQKVKGVAELVTTMLDGGLDKVVLFCWHKGVVEELHQSLKRFNPIILYGGTPPEKRARLVKKFQDLGKIRVAVCNHQAAGVGTTMTAAAHVIVVESSWVPADNAQSIMRCHRIGQTRPVTAQFVMLQGSAIDQAIAQTVRRKTQDFVDLFS